MIIIIRSPAVSSQCETLLALQAILGRNLSICKIQTTSSLWSLPSCISKVELQDCLGSSDVSVANKTTLRAGSLM